MTYQHTQCLIFCKRPTGIPAHWAGMHLQSIGRVTRSGAAGLSTRTVKAVALLPMAFCKSHQSVVSRFNENGVHIVRHGDELRIDGNEALHMVELLLEENREDAVGFLTMIVTFSHRVLKRIFDSTRLKFRKKNASCTDASTRPAIDDQNTEVFKCLLRGCRYHYRNSGHRLNLLSVASSNRQDLLVKLSLAHGADTEARCSKGRTALHYAAEARNDSSMVVQLLKDAGASINPTDQRRMTPLHIVENPEVAKTLLENGADLNVSCGDNRELTPLIHQIFDLENPGVIKILLDYGARVDFKFDSNLGLVINGRYAFNMYSYLVLEYLLNRCFVHVDFKYGNERLEQFGNRRLLFVFARHLVKIVSLNLRNRYSFNAADFWVEEQHRQSLPAFKEECELEVSRMKSQLIAGTDLSVYELLAKDEHQVARLLRNQSVTLDTNKLKEMFPEYGRMLTCVVENGRNRLAWHEQGIVSCKLLSADFKRMPDEIKEDIVSRLSIADIRSVIKACAAPS